MKITKRSFILLEIFIAITILAMVIIPLSSFPYKATQKQTEIMKTIESKRIYDLAYAKFLSQIEDNYNQSEIVLGDFFIELPPAGAYKYAAIANISKETFEDTHFLLQTTISLVPENKSGFIPSPQTYSLYVEIK